LPFGVNMAHPSALVKAFDGQKSSLTKAVASGLFVIARRPSGRRGNLVSSMLRWTRSDKRQAVSCLRATDGSTAISALTTTH